MFSDVIVEHAGGGGVNACWNEKTTQTDARRASESLRRPARAEDERLAAGAGLTCQELLALSGALGAALPTPLALPSYPDGPSPASAPAPIDDPPPAANSQPGVMPILAMSLWPEPFSGNGANLARRGARSTCLMKTGVGARSRRQSASPRPLPGARQLWRVFLRPIDTQVVVIGP